MNQHPRTPCEFCDEFSGGTANTFALHYAKDLVDRTILSTASIQVIPSIGQIVSGYLMLVPTQHCQAMADLSLATLGEVAALKDRISRTLQSTFGDYLFFEHGARTAGSGGCGISHAHLHAVPFPVDRDPVEEITRRFEFEEISSLTDLKRIPADKPYLYYETAGGRKLVFYPLHIPSQYIRQLLATALGVREWNWRLCNREERVLTTWSEASRLLTSVP